MDIDVVIVCNFSVPDYKYNGFVSGGRNCERPRQKLSLKKEIRVPFRAPLFLGKWYRVATYFFRQKIRKTKYIQIHD